MILLIAGGTHCGKTKLAQKLLEKYHYPYLSIDHLKMGLIRSGFTTLTPDSSDEQLTEFLWPIVREIVKTNIENNQHLIIEGCYIPFDYAKDFSKDYLKEIKYVCLVFSEEYIIKHFKDIQYYENEIEKRGYDTLLDRDKLIKENKHNLKMCQKYNCEYLLISDNYEVNYKL